MEIKEVNWEKIGGYILIVGSLASLFFYIADMKERTTKLETQYGYDARLNAIEEKMRMIGEEKVK